MTLPPFRGELPLTKIKGRAHRFVPSAARPSSKKTRRFPSPPFEGFGFVGTLPNNIISTRGLTRYLIFLINSIKTSNNYLNTGS
jgi:hypothetical protein